MPGRGLPIRMHMAVPRPILLVLIGTILLAATFFASQNARVTGSEQSATPAQPAKPADQPAQPAAPQPKVELTAPDAVKAILSPGKPVKSGRFEVRLVAQEVGGKRDREVSDISVAFQG